MIRPKQQIGAELYLWDASAKSHFQKRLLQKDVIEGERGARLEWEELADARTAIYQSNVDPKNQEAWPDQHAWLSRQLNAVHRVFAPRVANLTVGADTRTNTETRRFRAQVQFAGARQAFEADHRMER